MSDTADALESLVASEGWRLFVQHVKDEWSPSACWRKVKATSGSSFDVEKIDFTNVHVGHLMEWPQRTILEERRKEKEREPSQSRRGTL